MELSKEGVEFIQRWEGFENTAYLDIAGVPTIGYGHTRTVSHEDVRSKRRITLLEGDALFNEDVAGFVKAVNSLVRPMYINQNQFDMYVSLSFNIGVHAFENSTTLRRFEKGDIQGAAEAILWWNKATIKGKLKTIHGLVRRRKAEKAYFLTPVKYGKVLENQSKIERTICNVRDWF